MHGVTMKFTKDCIKILFNWKIRETYFSRRSSAAPTHSSCRHLLHQMRRCIPAAAPLHKLHTAPYFSNPFLIDLPCAEECDGSQQEKDLFSFFPFGKSKIRWTTVIGFATLFDPKLGSSGRFTGKVLTAVVLYASAAERHDRISCIILGWRALLKKNITGTGMKYYLYAVLTAIPPSTLPQDIAIFIKPTALLFYAIVTMVNNSKQTAAPDNNKPLPSAECIISLTGVRIFTLRHGCIPNGPRLIWGQNSDLYIPFLSTVFAH